MLNTSERERHTSRIIRMRWEKPKEQDKEDAKWQR